MTSMAEDQLSTSGWGPGVRRPPWAVSLHLARRKPLGAISLVLIVVLVLAALFAPLLAPYPPLEVHSGVRLVAPGGQYLLGTDDIGRDVLSRVIYGARISLKVGLVSTLLGTVAGLVLGVVSGYVEGKTDMIIQRVVDTFMAFPGLILALVLMSTLGPGVDKVIIAIGIVIIPGTTRVVRSATLATKQHAYVEAARLLGCSDVRIMARHVVPNVFAPVIVLASVALGNAILIEASLSFLGLGTPPPNPSWGGMLSYQGRFFMERAPWLAYGPGLAISLTVLSFNLFGDALRDLLDPRLRGT